MSSLLLRTSARGISAKRMVLPRLRLSTSAARGIVAASPARSISRPFIFSASVKNRAPTRPMSSTATICSEVVGFIAVTSWSPCRNQGVLRFSMKKVGLRIA